jgi:hypothetical protein
MIMGKEQIQMAIIVKICNNRSQSSKSGKPLRICMIKSFPAAPEDVCSHVKLPVVCNIIIRTGDNIKPSVSVQIGSLKVSYGRYVKLNLPFVVKTILTPIENSYPDFIV